MVPRCKCPGDMGIVRLGPDWLLFALSSGGSVDVALAFQHYAPALFLQGACKTLGLLLSRADTPRKGHAYSLLRVEEAQPQVFQFEPFNPSIRCQCTSARRSPKLGNGKLWSQRSGELYGDVDAEATREGSWLILSLAVCLEVDGHRLVQLRNPWGATAEIDRRAT